MKKANINNLVTYIDGKVEYVLSIEVIAFVITVIVLKNIFDKNMA